MAYKPCPVVWGSHGCDLPAGHPDGDVYHQCGDWSALMGDWIWKCSRIDLADDGKWYREIEFTQEEGMPPVTAEPRTVVFKDGKWRDVPV